MTSDGLLVLECLFDTLWRLFTSWHIPGTKTTPAAFFMFLAVCGLALKFLYRIIGLNPDAGSLIAEVPGRFNPVSSSREVARKE